VQSGKMFIVIDFLSFIISNYYIIHYFIHDSYYDLLIWIKNMNIFGLSFFLLNLISVQCKYQIIDVEVIKNETANTTWKTTTTTKKPKTPSEECDCGRKIKSGKIFNGVDAGPNENPWQV
jgi:hypothetical protein